MTIVKLPVVGMDASLDEVFDALKGTHRSAVLVPEGDQFRLVQGADVVVGRSQNVDTVRSLVKLATAQQSLFKPMEEKPRSWPFQLRKTEEGWELASIDVPNEDLAGRLGLELLFYYCDGPRRHGFLSSDVAPGQDCPYGDGRIVG